MDKHHDYRDTIEEAADCEECDRRAEAVDEKVDDEMMLDALAINGSMGMLGMDQTNANLIQLELAQELLYDLNYGEEQKSDEYQPFD